MDRKNVVKVDRFNVSIAFDSSSVIIHILHRAAVVNILQTKTTFSIQEIILWMWNTFSNMTTILSRKNPWISEIHIKNWNEMLYYSSAYAQNEIKSRMHTANEKEECNQQIDFWPKPPGEDRWKWPSIIVLFWHLQSYIVLYYVDRIEWKNCIYVMFWIELNWIELFSLR